MAIRVATAPVSWGVMEVEGFGGQKPFGEVLDEMKRAGYDGTELGPYGFLPTDPKALRAELSSRGLAILRELWTLRESLARAADRPPFKILSEEILLAIARAAPRDTATLATLPGVTSRVLGRWGGALGAAVERALAVPESELPQWPRRPRPRIPGAVSRRIEALRKWRAEATARIGLEPGVLLPNRVIAHIAEAGPRTVEALAAVDGVRRWRAETFGAELIAALSRS